MVNYPTSLDTDSTLYNVTDNVDYVLAIHHNALKDAVIAIETALGITGAFNFAPISHTQALSSITDPVGNTTWSLSNESLKLQFPNDIGGGMDGGLEIEAIGIFTGDLVHIHQHTGSVGAVTLLHIESVDTDVTPLKIVGTGTNSVDVTGNIAVSGTVDGIDVAGRDHDPTVAGDLNHNDLSNIDAGDIKHITAAQLGALHTVVVAGDLNHNDLANINAGDSYEHITQTQKDALHAIVTTLTHTALTGKNDETDIKHLTDAQQTALHAAVVAGDLNHNDLANIDAGDIKHITAAQLGALHTVVVAGDLNHNDLANINAGDTYEHISATQLAALHTKYALTEDLSSNEIAQLQTIGEVTTIIAGQWGYVGALTEDVQTHMTAGNPHTSSASDTDLSNHAGDEDAHHLTFEPGDEDAAIATHAALTATHGVTEVADVADLHSENHPLTTSGTHTGALPLIDLALGTSGDIIIMGSSDWEVLNKGSDSDVLTLVSGYPAWQTAGAPGSHTIDSGSHSDVGTISEAKGVLLWWAGSAWDGLAAAATVGHILVCDNVDGTISWQAPAGAPPHTMASHSDDDTYDIVTTGDIDLNPIGAGDILSITPTITLPASTSWRGMHVDGSSLDPTGANCEISGLKIHFSGISMTNNPNVWGLHVTMPATYGSATEYAARLEGDAKVVEFCNDLYAIEASAGATKLSIAADDDTYTGIVTSDGGVLKYRTKAEILSDIGAAPALHDLDSSIHGDVSSVVDAKGAMLYQAVSGTWSRLTPPDTVGEILACDNIDGAISWQAPAGGGDDVANLIGAANSALIPCIRDVSGDPYTIMSYAATAATICNVDGNDHEIWFTLPMPVERGGLSLHLASMVLSLEDADGDDYINYIQIYGLENENKWNWIYDDTNRTAKGRYVYNFTDQDTTGYDHVKVGLRCVVTTRLDLRITAVGVECYYDT